MTHPSHSGCGGSTATYSFRRLIVHQQGYFDTIQEQASPSETPEPQDEGRRWELSRAVVKFTRWRCVATCGHGHQQTALVIRYDVAPTIV